MSVLKLTGPDILSFLQVVEISEVEKVQDPGFRSNSAAPPRGGLARGLSLSSPNVPGDPDLLDRIRGLERQIFLINDKELNKLRK